METGRMRKQVTLQTEQRSEDGAGGYVLSWAPLATFWAEITPLTGSEGVAAGRLVGRITHKITLRWRDDLNSAAALRLLYGARALNIRSVLNKGESNRFAEIYAEEGVAT